MRTFKTLEEAIRYIKDGEDTSRYHWNNSAGDWDVEEYLFDDIPTDTIEVEDTPTARKADFVVGANGDSMEPDFYDGDKVFVKKTVDLNVGDIGIFLKGSDCYIKELGADRLISHNKSYKDIYADEEIRRIGKVLGKVDENQRGELGYEQ